MSFGADCKISDFISLLALLMSVYSTIKTVSFNKRQNKFIETYDELNKALLTRQQQENLAEKKAEISANFISLGKSNYRLKVFNRGKTSATNVRIEFPEGNELLSKDDLEDKFRMPILEPQQSIDIQAYVHMGSPRILKVKLIWDDPSEQGREKISTIAVN